MVQADTKTQTTTLCNRSEQKSISEQTKRQTLWWTGYNSQRPSLGFARVGQEQESEPSVGRGSHKMDR